MAWNDSKMELNGVEWYLAKNVCATIGVQNTTMAMRKISETYKQKVPIGLNKKETWIINAKGVIQLLQKSKKETAMSILEEDFNILKVKLSLSTKTRGVYKLLKECKVLLGEGDDIVGVNILPIMQLYLLSNAVEYPNKAMDAYNKWIRILINTDNIKNISPGTRKYIAAKKQPKKMSLVWIKKFINLGYLRNYRVMSADTMVFTLLESQFSMVNDMRYGKKRLYWLGPEPHMFFRRDKLIGWINTILQTKPFADGARCKTITPKSVVQEIIESISLCKNKRSDINKSDYWDK